VRQLVMWNIVTLDGFFEGTAPWELSWHEQIWGEELERFSIEQLRSADMLIFGRRTYEGMAAHWRTAENEIARYMNGLPKLVFSRTLKSAAWQNSSVVREDPAQVIPALKRNGCGHLFVFGSALLSRALMDAELFDEYRIAVAPVLAGSGRRLFDGAQGAQKLQLRQTRTLQTGGVILHYGAGAAA
jgi:dihydrofolate reductase